MSAVKVNGFWQRVLKKNNNEAVDVDNEAEKEKQRTEPGRPGLSKGNWIRKLGNYSPTKCQVPASPMRTNPIRVLDRSGPCNTYEAATPRRTSGSPKTPLEMPDLESIIHEFEMGYLSPSKQDTAPNTSKQKNFVKMIVAAFEVKYKAYDDLKTEQEARESQEAGKSDPTATETPKRRSRIFSSPFKSGSEEFKRLGKLDDSPSSKPSREDAKDAKRRSGIFSTPSKTNSDDSNYSRKWGIFSTPFKMASDEGRDQVDHSRTFEEGTKNGDRSSGIFFTPTKDESEDSNGSRSSGVFSSPLNRSGSKDSSDKSDIYATPVVQDREDSQDSNSDSSCIFKFDKEEPSEKTNFHFSPLMMSSLDDTKTMDSIDLSVTLPEPEETIFLSGNNLPKTSTMINEIPREEGNPTAAAPATSVDRAPKIVGAFLKKPIEVEDTSIDWIPITGKKLPRKRSLKKLLSSLTGKKSLEKRSKMFSSQRNLYEDSRELQDSGYDERSCSSSSLTSLVSITEALLQQENSYVEPERRSILRTFRSRHSMDEEEDEAFYDAYPTTKKQSAKKLLLTEIPRDEVKLDLGPCYPPPLKRLTMSLDRKTGSKKAHCPSPVYAHLSRVPKHPHLSKIPKHPFVALTKMDEHLDSLDPLDPLDREVLVIKNDLYEVEFRRSTEDISSSASCHSCSSTQSHYDVPRRFLSKSETEISQLCKSTGTRGEQQPIYDVPRTCSIERPRSSVHDEALSQKRCSVILAEPIFEFNTVSRVTESHYDTVRSKNCRVYRNERVARSDTDLPSIEKRSPF